MSGKTGEKGRRHRGAWPRPTWVVGRVKRENKKLKMKNKKCKTKLALSPKKPPMQFTKMIEFLFETGRERLRELLRAIDVSILCDEKGLRLRHEQTESQQYKEALEEDAWLLREVIKLSRQLVIVGLFSLVEREVKRLARWVFADVPEKTMLGEIYCALREERIFDDKKTKAFKDKDELRLLNNAIKHHGGIVSAELAGKYNRWILDQEINVTDSDIDKYFESVRDYLSEYSGKIDRFLAEAQTLKS